MKKPTRAAACGLHLSRWWVWVSLIPVLAGGCKPRDLVCETKAVFQALNPGQGAGSAPFSIERLGPEVKVRMLERQPLFITLKGDNHGDVEWLLLGHIDAGSDVIYSPAEGLVRDIKHPEHVHPMKRLPGGATERVWLGFRSAVCPDPQGSASFCKFGDEELYLVADMTCHRE